jgi:hypothetical protein
MRCQPERPPDPRHRRLRQAHLGAGEQVDQCVASLGVVSNVVVITRSTSASASAIVRGRPGRGSSSRPSNRSTANRLRHFVTVCRAIWSCYAITVFDSPAASAHASTIRDRNANACALLGRPAQTRNRSRS